MVQLHLKEPSTLKTALRSFTVLEDPIYANKQLGLSGQLEVMACDCHQHAPDGPMCAADSNCINRLTYMECLGEHCGCDMRCANRRFQNHEHARIDVFKAGKKGFGVRAMEDMPKGTFIAEYTGEVLDETRFQRRQKKYDDQGVKHFYFMMLQKDEFIDATEKGSVARFCNHSCNPNAVIEKWAVGPRLRMGLFAKRDIERGEEICFDYKVDRYGATAQPCYCGEPNCSGFLGGRTQTGGVLLPPSVVEGLGLDSDSALSWPERAEQLLSQLELPSADREGVLKYLDQKKRSKLAALLALLDAPPSSANASGDAAAGDAAGGSARASGSARATSPAPSTSAVQAARTVLLGSFECPPITEDIPEFLRILFQTQDRGWLVALMLKRVLNSKSPTDSEILRLHGYEIMGTVLNRWQGDPEVLAPALSVLAKWPKVTKNKISSSKIESVVQSIRNHASGEVLELANALIKEWSNLEMGYRIPRRSGDRASSEDRDDVSAETSKPAAATATAAEPSQGAPPAADATSAKAKPSANRHESRRRPLPPGWEAAQTDEGRVYYINKAQNRTTWEFPKEVRDTDLDEHRRERERRESEKHEAYLRIKEAQREAQQEEIRRIIEASASAQTTPTPSPAPSGTSRTSTAGVPRSSVAVTGSSHENTPATPKTPRKSAYELAFAAYVPKVVFASEAELGHDRCKRHARDIVHILAKKEESKRTDPAAFELTVERKRKIKGFIRDYMAKVSAHHQRRMSGEVGPAAKKARHSEDRGRRRSEHDGGDTDRPKSKSANAASETG